MTTATKDVTINENRYQLLRLSARNGSWVVGQFLTKVLLGRIENPDKELDEKSLGLILSLVFNELPEEIFTAIQGKCLAVCRRYDPVGDTTIPVPVIRADGSWNGVTEPGLPELITLTIAALVFNLYPFFEPAALKMLLTVFPNVSQLNSSSMAISSDQSLPGTGNTEK